MHELSGAKDNCKRRAQMPEMICPPRLVESVRIPPPPRWAFDGQVRGRWPPVRHLDTPGTHCEFDQVPLPSTERREEEESTRIQMAPTYEGRVGLCAKVWSSNPGAPCPSSELRQNILRESSEGHRRLI